MIVDETHHPPYSPIITSFLSSPRGSRVCMLSNVLKTKPRIQISWSPTKHSIPIIGVSATFSRYDGLALGSVFDRNVCHLDFLDMIECQWSYIRPDSAFIHTDMIFVAGYTTRNSRASRQT